MKPKNMNEGFSTTAAIVALRKKDLVTKKQIADFFSDVITFLVSVVEKCLRGVRFPIQFVLLEYLTRKKWFLLMLSCYKVKWKNICSILLNWVLDNVSSDKGCDQFIHFIQNDSTLNLDKFKSFDRKDKRLEYFYFHVVGIRNQSKS